MGRRKYEHRKYRKLSWSQRVFGEDVNILVELKTVLSMICLELVLFLLTVYKGLGLVYLPIAMTLILLFVIGYGVTLCDVAKAFKVTLPEEFLYEKEQ